jgi:hypothetical protein
MQIQIRINGLKELIQKNKKLIKDLESNVFNEAFAIKVTNRAKYVAPRKTGKLIRGIHYKLSGSNIIILCPVKNEQGVAYPEILEFGLNRFIPIGTPENPRIYTSSSGKRAFLPYIRWAVWRTLRERDKLFKEVMLKQYY